jgi:hypothetical protein
MYSLSKASIGQALEPNSEFIIAGTLDKELEEISSPNPSPKKSRMKLALMENIISSGKFKVEPSGGKRGGPNRSREKDPNPDPNLPKSWVFDSNNPGGVSQPPGYTGMIDPEVFRQEDFNDRTYGNPEGKNKSEALDPFGEFSIAQR